MKQILIFVFAILSSPFFLQSCKNEISNKNFTSDTYDFPQIKDSGTIVVLTTYSSTTYFLYRGEPMGFQYELAEQFARSQNLKFEIKIASNPQELEQMLLNREGDLIAYNVPISSDRKNNLLFCGEEIISHQVLVQKNSRKKSLIKDVIELIGKKIYVKSGRSLQRIQNLNKELGGGIDIYEVKEDSITEEDLIALVSLGEIDYTVCDNDIAQLNKTYYPNINVKLQVGLDQPSSWAVRKNSPLLAEAVNQWKQLYSTTSAYRASMKRHFESAKNMPHSFILSIQKGKISHYDDLFKQYADSIGWNWKLLASLAYTESNFDTAAVSWAGAKGLMQLMPHTAHVMGVPPGKEHNPEESIKAASKYIKTMNRSFRNIENDDERINFILAAYNAGIGHIYDAMALAEKYGKDKYKWHDNVEKYILLKSKPEYFNDSVCKYGYFRGFETYNFVREIRGRYKIYCEKIKE